MVDKAPQDTEEKLAAAYRHIFEAGFNKEQVIGNGHDFWQEAVRAEWRINIDSDTDSSALIVRTSNPVLSFLKRSVVRKSAEGEGGEISIVDIEAEIGGMSAGNWLDLRLDNVHQIVYESDERSNIKFSGSEGTMILHLDGEIYFNSMSASYRYKPQDSFS